MAVTKNPRSKPQAKTPKLTLEALFFSSPEQKVIRLLLNEPNRTFSLREICSKLKGIRGLGGVDGLSQILLDLQSMGLVDFIDNNRGVRVQADNSTIQVLATFLAICELEHLKTVLQPISSKGILYGNLVTGRALESDYHLFVVSETPDDIRNIADHHPLRKSVELVVYTPELYGEMKKHNPTLFHKVAEGITLWGTTW